MQNPSRTAVRTDALIAAFAAAEYVVDAPDDSIVIRVGETNATLDRLLADRPWAVITAHNPDGRPCDEETNATAQRLLEAELRKLQPAVLLDACNRDPAGLWPDEPSWLFTRQGICQADRLARKFGQRAILAGRAGSPAQLRIYGESPGATGPAAAMIS